MNDNNNIVNMPDNKNQSPPPRVFKYVMYSVFIFLIFVQFLKFYTGPSALERKHEVQFFRKPIDIAQSTFQSLDGQSYSFADLKGKNVIIAFWAPWCKYCKHEIPAISSMSSQLERMNYQVIPLVKNNESIREIENFYSNITGTEPFITGDRFLYGKLNIAGVPQFVLVNEKGYAVAKMRPNWSAGDALTLFSQLRESTLMQGQERFPSP